MNQSLLNVMGSMWSNGPHTVIGPHISREYAFVTEIGLIGNLGNGRRLIKLISCPFHTRFWKQKTNKNKIKRT